MPNERKRRLSDIAAILSAYGPYLPQDRPYEINGTVKFSDKADRLFGEPHRQMKEFTIRGRKVMAYSKKDAITRLKHIKHN